MNLVHDCSERLSRDLWKQLLPRICVQLVAKTWDEIRAEIPAEICAEIRAEILAEIQAQIQAEI